MTRRAWLQLSAKALGTMSLAAPAARLVGAVAAETPSPTETRAPAASGKRTVAQPDWPRLRGVCAPLHELDPSDVIRVKKLGCNLLATHFSQDAREEANRTGNMFAGVPPTKENPLAPYQQMLARLDLILAECRKQQLPVCLSAARLYGMPSVDVLWQKTAGLNPQDDHLVQFWRALAKRLQPHEGILMYEVLGEPVWEGNKSDLWRKQLLPAAIAAIRESTPDIWMLVEPGPWGLPGGFNDMPLADDPKVVYGFHHYGPHNYTHNFPERDATGKLVYPKGPLSYPGMMKEFDGSPLLYWDKQQLRKYFQPAIDFQQRYGTRMFIGEFSVNRWAQGGDRWLADSIDLFEELGWDWTFFTLVSWNGWNPTFGPDAKPSLEKDGGVETARMKILRRAWAKNAHKVL